MRGPSVLGSRWSAVHAADRVADVRLTVTLLSSAAVAWWAALRMSAGSEAMGLALAPFLLAWAAMMAAMMLPAVTPVVRLYARAARDARVAPAGFFVSGYLAVWLLSGLPAAVWWRAVRTPLMDGSSWALRVAAATLVAAGAYQLSPLKRACLRHCRSPLGHFMRAGRELHRPAGALRAGAEHGAYCLGCCVGLILVLLTAVAMQPLWAVVVAATVLIERNLRRGESFSLGVSAALVLLGGAALVEPGLAAALTQGVLT